MIADRRERIARLTGDLASATTRLEAAQPEASREGNGRRPETGRGRRSELAGMPEAPEGEGTGSGAIASVLPSRPAMPPAPQSMNCSPPSGRRGSRAHWEARRDALAQGRRSRTTTPRVCWGAKGSRRAGPRIPHGREGGGERDRRTARPFRRRSARRRPRGGARSRAGGEKAPHRGSCGCSSRSRARALGGLACARGGALELASS